MIELRTRQEQGDRSFDGQMLINHIQQFRGQLVEVAVDCIMSPGLNTRTETTAAAARGVPDMIPSHVEETREVSSA